MTWFKAERTSGEKNQPGEFWVHDGNGLDWQVQVIPSKTKPGKLACARPVVCVNADYEPGCSTELDIFEAVREVLEEEK